MPDIRIMGVVNVTPDSFSDGGRFASTERAVAHAVQLIDDGADILDIGGESTRPGASSVDAAEELARVEPVIKGIRRIHATIPISIDTMKASVARVCLAAGATIINDVTAGTNDPEMIPLAASAGVPLVLMHMQGEPRTMQDAPTYTDVVIEVREFLDARAQVAQEAGVADVWIDPGIGFGKTLEHNLALVRAFSLPAERPVVIGISRKRFLGALSGIDDPSQRDEVTAMMHAAIITHWRERATDASMPLILRTHDVRRTVMVRRIVSAL
jgi:dihydropteroate synthase